MNGLNQCPLFIRVQSADFDIAEEIGRLGEGRKDIGAIVSFTGLCRDEGGKLSALELEHYPGMVEAEIRRIAAQASKRWPLSGITIIHRYGMIRPGEKIILVATASVHRHAAFEAASFLMDFMKTDAPFWKREHLLDGNAGSWIESKAEDHQSRERWKKS
ncbi:molybdenum cofactor biosynthesis protein MoaE [Brucella gallinifaecis]|uniref:Molybdopterin synthase catalytic subunit n=1 Tax=Brucella gallinifaecis TaxID=215590 RepID=A0A502BN92_9HYPH|nr:molybdenum cofactor biosynthesis protein MoaE [Brucella gallinifaecis]TPF75982.1 molybdenum cofactor biosynthesis protein MoaE [Brucella gallinifaecis]